MIPRAKSIALFFSLCLVGLIFSTCSFKLENKYVNPLSPPPSTIAVTVEVNDSSFTDPYLLLVPTNFIFTLKGTIFPIAAYSVELDGNSIATGQNATAIEFSIDPNTLSDGNHKVTLEGAFSTGSGSLANQIGQENYGVNTSFTVVVDKTPPSVIPTPTLTIEGGFLTARWPQLSKKNFTLSIDRYLPNLQTHMPSVVLADPFSTKFIDPDYVGGPVVYTLHLAGIGFETNSLPAEFTIHPIEVTITVDASSIVHLSWPQPVIIGLNPSIVFQGNGWQKSYPMTANEITGDTLILGSQVYETTTIVSSDRWYYESTPVNSTANIIPFTFNSVLPVQNKLILAEGNQIYRYDLTSFTAEDSVDIPIDAGQSITSLITSPDGQTVIISGKSGVQKFWKFDPLNFASIVEIPLTALLNAREGSITLMDLANNDLLATGSLTGPSQVHTTSILDLNQSLVTWTTSDPFVTQSASLSDDGQFLVAMHTSPTFENLAYQWSSAQWQSKGNLPGLPGVFLRNSSKILIQNSFVEIYDPLSVPGTNGFFIPEKSFSLNGMTNNPDRGFVGYDPSSGKFVFELITGSQELRKSTIIPYDLGSFTPETPLKALVPYNNLIPPPVHSFSGDYHFLNTGYAAKTP